jgi:hypothetical protein
VQGPLKGTAMQPTWYVISLPPEAKHDGRLLQMEREFEELMIAAGAPRGVELFRDPPEPDQPVTSFFPAETMLVLEAFLTRWGAVPSGPPRVARAPIFGHARSPGP